MGRKNHRGFEFDPARQEDLETGKLMLEGASQEEEISAEDKKVLDELLEKANAKVDDPVVVEKPENPIYVCEMKDGYVDKIRYGTEEESAEAEESGIHSRKHTLYRDGEGKLAILPTVPCDPAEFSPERIAQKKMIESKATVKFVRELRLRDPAHKKTCAKCATRVPLKQIGNGKNEVCDTCSQSQ